jgi:hypothetical protein
MGCVVKIHVYVCPSLSQMYMLEDICVLGLKGKEEQE